MHNEPNSFVERADVGVSALSRIPVKLERANTLANRAAEYMEVELAGWAPRGLPKVRTELNKLVRYYENREFNRETAIGYGRWLLKNGNIKGFNRAIERARSFFRWLYRMQYIDEPMNEFLPRTMPEPVKEVVTITEEEYLRFVEANRQHPFGWAIVLAYHTAFRLGDVCTLKWSEVDMANQVIRKVPNKTARTGLVVEVPILSGSDLYEWLARMQSDRDPSEEYVCPELWYRYRDQPSLPHEISKRLRKHGINATFHDLRKTFESRLANSGINLGLAAKITGRTDPRSLMRYIKPDPDVVRQSVALALELPGRPAVNSSLPAGPCSVPVAPIVGPHSGSDELDLREVPINCLV